MSINQARVHAGVPTGGQFSTMVREESGVTLDDLADQYLDGYFDDEGDRDAVERAIENAYASARHWERSKGVTNRSSGYLDVDDMAQEGLLAVLERQANGHTVENPKAYAHSVIWGVAQQAGNTAVRQEDRKALGIFARRVEEVRARLGRDLTSAEQDAIATDIRNNWHDQRRKPSVEFRSYAGYGATSLDKVLSEDGTGESLADMILPATPAVDEATRPAGEVTPGSFTDRALDAVEGHSGDLRDARRLLWNALAESSEAPLVSEGTLSQRRVTAVRATVTTAGGVESALSAWDKGEDSPEVTEALFAPWGETDDETRDQIVNQMLRFPNRAEDLWDSALKLANTRNAGR